MSDPEIFSPGPVRCVAHTHDPAMKKFWLDNFDDLLVQKEFFAKNHKDGVLYDYPLSEESIEKFPEEIKKKVKKELKEINPENVMRAQNFKEVVTAIVGPTLSSWRLDYHSWLNNTIAFIDMKPFMKP